MKKTNTRIRPQTFVFLSCSSSFFEKPACLFCCPLTWGFRFSSRATLAVSKENGEKDLLPVVQRPSSSLASANDLASYALELSSRALSSRGGSGIASSPFEFDPPLEMKKKLPSIESILNDVSERVGRGPSPAPLIRPVPLPPPPPSSSSRRDLSTLPSRPSSHLNDQLARRSSSSSALSVSASGKSSFVPPSVAALSSSSAASSDLSGRDAEITQILEKALGPTALQRISMVPCPSDEEVDVRPFFLLVSARFFTCYFVCCDCLSSIFCKGGWDLLVCQQHWHRVLGSGQPR